MSSKNYKWQTKWSVDLVMCRVTHEDGIAFDMDIDQNGKVTCAIVKEGKSQEYIDEKFNKYHFSQFTDHMCRMARQAEKFFIEENARSFKKNAIQRS